MKIPADDSIPPHELDRVARVHLMRVVFEGVEALPNLGESLFLLRRELEIPAVNQHALVHHDVAAQADLIGNQQQGHTHNEYRD